MSGILGIVNFDGQPVDPTDLNRMSEKMAHRGPDGFNIILDSNVGFGQLMLCSTPESLSETLPWQDPVSGLLITADARIDNREELISALSMASSTESPIPDSQLILTAYRKWGKACVDHLLGDFSFAIWDEKNRQLFVARDHMGIRPFYYYSCKNFFVFASAANAIAQVSRVPNQVDEGRVADFLIQELEGINNTSTFFNDIYRMPPAHFGIVEKGTVSFQRYWKPDPEKSLHLSSDEEYADALEDTLRLAIKARLRSHLPVASMLSGGADSSTITGIARDICKANGSGPLRTYSGVSDDVSNCCESGFIKKVIGHGDLNPVLLSPAQVINHSAEFERTAGKLEDPFGENWTILRLIYTSARQHGSVAVMDGMGGDLVTGLTTGYPSYLLRKGDIRQAFRETHHFRINFYERDISRYKAYLQLIRPVITPDFLRRLRASYLRHGQNERDLSQSLLSKEFVEKIQLTDRWKEYKEQSTIGFCPSLRHKHAETIVVPYLTAAIERYERLASYYGIETRQPFHDKRVVELCLSLPWQQKARNGHLKYCLRNVLERVAPKEVAWRTEFDSIMWKFGAAWDEMNRESNLTAISEGRNNLKGIVDKQKLDQIIDRYKKGDAEAKDPIGNVVSILNWLKNQTPPA